ncbi:MAG: hypothetical protein JW797_06610 [Bradymonadales bacterium]|nr:hypothetical protein [Bradymonadales bacterium]
MTTSDYNGTMKAVGIKKLKAQLSEYIRMARAGEVILVTDRDEVVAEIRPARRHGLAADDPDVLLQDLADACVLSMPAQRKGDWSWSPRGLGLEWGAAQKLLDELREDTG